MRALPAVLLLLLPFSSLAEVVVPITSVQNHVNIRMSADAKSEVVGKLQQGTSLPLVASTPGWHEVEISGGATGFISADWTEIQGDGTQAQAQAEDEPEPDADSDTADTVADASTPVEGQDLVEEVRVSVDADEADIDVSPDVAEAAVVEPTKQEESDPVEEVEVEVVAEGTVSKAEEATTSDEIAVAETDVVDDGEDSVVEAESESMAESQSSDTSEQVAEDLSVTTNDDNAKQHESASKTSMPVATGAAGSQGPRGETGPAGPPGPPGAAGAGSIEGSVDFLVKFAAPTIGANSQVFDDGNNIGIGTTEPKQRLEVNGNIQIHERNSSVAGLMITQSSGETGYIMHNMASTLTIGAGSIDRITINRDGDVGIGVSRPSHPMEMASGAYVSAGGVWTNSSSRERKENIAGLTPEQAIAALVQLEPVEFNYKNDQQEKYVGFIAEDVPALVATADRQSLSTMDIVAVLTKVVQEQQKKIEELEARLDER